MLMPTIMDGKAVEEREVDDSICATTTTTSEHLGHHDAEGAKCETELDLARNDDCTLDRMEVRHLKGICERQGLLGPMQIAAASKQNNKPKVRGEEVYTDEEGRSREDYVGDARDCIRIREFKAEDPGGYNRMVKDLISEKVNIVKIQLLDEEAKEKSGDLLLAFHVIMARHDPDGAVRLTEDQVDEIFRNVEAYDEWQSRLQRRRSVEAEKAAIDRELSLLGVEDFVLDDFAERRIMPSLVSVDPYALDRLASRGSYESPGRSRDPLRRHKLVRKLILGYFVVLVPCLVFVAVLVLKKLLLRANENAARTSSRGRRNEKKRKANKRKKKD